MKIESQGDLSKLLTLLRKSGVKSFKFGDLDLELLPEAPPSNYKRAQAEAKDEDKETLPDWNELSEEEKLFYSAPSTQ